MQRRTAILILIGDIFLLLFLAAGYLILLAIIINLLKQIFS